MTTNSNYNASFTHVTGRNEMTTKLAHMFIQKITTFYSIYAERFILNVLMSLHIHTTLILSGV